MAHQVSTKVAEQAAATDMMLRAQFLPTFVKTYDPAGTGGGPIFTCTYCSSHSLVTLHLNWGMGHACPCMPRDIKIHER